ncbi:MAG: hypothetical protein F2729_01225 [Actinobacteria bacterium]|uniref:Unannotated protein n=1 Tax=freshwater metagenome TaxID=449393 RepID=A0A6J6W1U4_9ZZZZ|nr:hypothetical protein [Actinomycetota bacterium]
MAGLRERLRSARGVAWVLIAAFVAVVGHSSSNAFGQIFLLVTILLLPGSAIASLLKIRLESISSRVILTVAFGTSFIMVMGYLVSLAGPHVGVDRPLDRIPQLWIWGVVLLVLTIACAIVKRDPVSYVFEGVEPYHVYYSSIFLVFPIVAAIGAFRLNGGHGNDVAVVNLVVIIGLVVFTSIVTWRRDVRFPISALIYSISLAVVWSYSLRAEHLNGWDIQQEFGVCMQTFNRGIWIVPPDHSAYAAMLSLTSFPVQLHSLSGVAFTWIFKAVFTALLALVPLGIFLSVRRVATDGAATATSSLLVIGSIAYPQEMATLGRQAIAFVLLTSIVVILGENIGTRNQRLYFMVMGVSLSFTHYSTAYFQASILFVAWLATFIATGFKRKNRRETVITFGPVICTLIAAVTWNLVITDNNALVKPSSRIVESGLALSASSGIKKVPVEQYQGEILASLKVLVPQLEVLREGRTHTLQDTAVPTLKGVAPGLIDIWNKITILKSDLVNVALSLSVPYLLYLWKREPERYSTEEDLFALGVGALFGAMLFRFSGTLAQFYNPERGALLSNLYFSVPLAVAIMRSIRWRPKLTGTLVISAMAIAMFDVFGLSRFLIGGGAPSSIVGQSESSERFFVSEAEYNAALWAQAHIPKNNLVQTDQYGKIAFLNAPGKYNLLSAYAPNILDWRAFVYESKVNLINHRSRGETKNSHHTTIYVTPTKYFDDNYRVVYSSEFARMYH